tara:strand:+ start:29 stop:1669 length:1641 start_codon:yes stop_codon:yes gene_type:complete
MEIGAATQKFTSSNESLKEELGNIKNSIQSEITSIEKQFSLANQKVEIKLQNGSDELTELKNSIAERQRSLEESFSEKFNDNNKKISNIGIQTEKIMSDTILDFTNKNSILETDVNQKMKHTEDCLKNVQEQVENQIGYLNTSLRGHIVSITTDQEEKINGIEKLVKNNTKSSSQANKALQDRLQELNRSLLLEIASITQKFTSANEVLKKELDDINNSIQVKISSIEKNFSSASQKIEKKLQASSNEFLNFKKSVEKRHNSLEDSFSEKLHKSDDKILAVSTEFDRKISEISHDFANKTNTLETEINNKLEHTEFHLQNLEEQIENQIGYLNTSLRGYVLSITAGQDEKIDALSEQVYLLQEQLQSDASSIKALVMEQKQLMEDDMAKYAFESNKKNDAKADKIQDNVKSLKQELFENHRDQKAELDKKLKASDLKTNDILSKKILEVRELQSGEINSLTQELNNLKDVVEERHSELTTNIENSVSDIRETVEKDRETFNNQFEKVSKTIETVDSKIVKEDDLTELFQNYTLNVNITGNENPKKG